MFISPKLFCLELKSTKGTSFSFQGKTPMIKEHQIKELTKANEYDDVIAGFIFNFREPENVVYFMHIDNFIKFKEETTKGSINKKDMINYGVIEITSELKRSRYRYNIKEFIDKVIN